VFVTYKKGTRKLFVAARQMLYPKGVEGDLPSSSAKQVRVEQQSKGKEKVQEEDLGDK